MLKIGVLAANKKTIADITEMAIQAFDQRDECQSKIQALHERNEKDAIQYASELKVRFLFVFVDFIF